MTRTIHLSDEELAVLDEILQAEMDSDKTELRRTRNSSFRAEVQHRIELTERLIESVHRAETRSMDEPLEG